MASLDQVSPVQASFLQLVVRDWKPVRYILPGREESNGDDAEKTT